MKSMGSNDPIRCVPSHLTRARAGVSTPRAQVSRTRSIGVQGRKSPRQHTNRRRHRHRQLAVLTQPQCIAPPARTAGFGHRRIHHRPERRINGGDTQNRPAVIGNDEFFTAGLYLAKHRQHLRLQLCLCDCSHNLVIIELWFDFNEALFEFRISE